MNLVGATPKLADATSLDDWNMSESRSRNKITERTKAVIVVHRVSLPRYHCDQPTVSIRYRPN